MSGTWLCTEVTDFEPLLQKLGVNWVKRNFAKAFNFGKNRAIQNIVVEGSRITIIIKGAYTFTNVFVLGARDQTGLGPDMSEMNCEECTLQNSELVLIMTHKTLDKRLVAKRYIREDGKMIQHFECEGVVASRELTKQ
eukprot:8548835-Pyramimonas_sp.AAC.1